MEPRLNLSMISDLTIDMSIEEASVISEDRPDHWTYPHVPYIKQLYKMLRDQGFYEPHAKLVPKTRRDVVRGYDDGKVSITLQVHLEFSVCTLAPSKIQFIDHLGFIQPLKEDQERDDFKGAPREWFQLVADKISEQCQHEGCCKNTAPAHALVRDCFNTVPKPDLGRPYIEQPPYFVSEEHEEGSCCKINREGMLNNHLSLYGYSVTKDIFEHDKKEAEMYHLRLWIENQRKLWKKAFVHEMKLQLGLYMPQEVPRQQQPEIELQPVKHFIVIE